MANIEWWELKERIMKILSKHHGCIEIRKLVQELQSEGISVDEKWLTTYLYTDDSFEIYKQGVYMLPSGAKAIGKTVCLSEVDLLSREERRMFSQFEKHLIEKIIKAVNQMMIPRMKILDGKIESLRKKLEELEDAIAKREEVGKKEKEEREEKRWIIDNYVIEVFPDVIVEDIIANGISSIEAIYMLSDCFDIPVGIVKSEEARGRLRELIKMILKENRGKKLEDVIKKISDCLDIQLELKM